MTAAAVCLACATVTGTAVAAAGPIAPATGRPASSSLLPASVTFTGAGRRIPASFFGLSLEYKELKTYEQAGPLFDRVISLIRPRDGGPMLFRIGGKSADHVWWHTAKGPPPQWVTKIDQSWLARLSRLVQRNDLRVILDLNLAVHSSTMATKFVSAAVKALPQSSIAGLEVGNEPDLYWRQPWLEKQRIRSTGRGVPQHWTLNYSASNYRRDYQVYAEALAKKDPGIPLGAPDIISSKPDWLNAMTGLGSLDPGFIAIHRYASSTCWPPDSPFYPTIPKLLDERASAGLAGTVAGAVSFANSHHMALRLTEVNSISCGGNAGVANSFATSLWTPDALFEMIRAGVAGVSWHIRPSTLNAPFHLDPGGIEPLPELYGLAVFAQMTHGPANLIDSRLVGSSALHLKAWEVRRGGSSTVLLINKGGHAADVKLPVSGASAAAAIVRRLEAPSVSSASGLKLAGRTIGADGRWHGREVTTAIRDSGGFYYVPLPGYSAATVTLRS